MIRIISIFIVLCFLSCKRNENINEHINYKSKPLDVCDFGQGKYNAIKRLSPNEIQISFRNSSRQPKGLRDTDRDGIKDVNDNCTAIFNPDQLDSDLDGLGDACDNIDDDIDRDGIFNSIDNCPKVYNPLQEDIDGDGIGDVCDVAPVTDTDKDGIVDALDNCVNTPNANQLDTDKDGVGDACDTVFVDTDKDGIQDLKDNCVNVFNPDQADDDKDGIGNACDAPNNPNIFPYVVFVDFDGYTLTRGYWKLYADTLPFYFAPSGLNQTEIDNVMIGVYNDYKSFPITFTTDSTVYLKADPFKRIRVIVTETDFYCQSCGGVAYNGSIKWGGNDNDDNYAPAFVFSKKLSYRQKIITDVIKHETGHTLTLRHQAKWDTSTDTCRFLSEYFNGDPSPYSPIMGYPYSKPSIWWIGLTPGSCKSIQNDSLKILEYIK